MEAVAEFVFRILRKLELEQAPDLREFGCESPIEGWFLVWFLVYGTRDDRGASGSECNITARCGTQLSGGGVPAPFFEFHSQRDVAFDIVLTTQQPVGEYRVDFLLEITAARGPRKGETLRIVAECDGYEFHQKDKEQVSRDNRRDRALQMNGYQIFRYPGSDIRSFPYKWVPELFSYFDDFVRSSPA